jgi:hypothetical protein
MRRSKKVITMAKQVSMIVIARAHDALKKRATATTDKNARIVCSPNPAR